MTSAPHQRGLWPLRPPPREKERIDHWLRRVAKAYGLTTPIFCCYALGIPRGHIHLLRMNPSKEVLAKLEAGTGVSVQRLQEMTEGALLEQYNASLEQSRRCLAKLLKQYPNMLNAYPPPRQLKTERH